MKKLDYNIPIFPELKNIQGMISENERKFLYYYASQLYSDCGRIVDLGCWLGATTLSLAAGLRENKLITQSEKQIFSYDLFYWDDSMEIQVKGTKYEGKLKNGENFLPVFNENLKDYCDIVDARTDLIKTGWHGDKIEFLLIDAMKSPMSTRYILDKFYPFLIPGKSMIFHQDFDHYLTPWIHILIFLHKPFTKHFHDVPGVGGTIFSLQENIPTDILCMDFMNMDELTVRKAFNYCFKISAKTKHSGIAAAHVAYYIYQRKFDEAFYTWTDYLWKGFELDYNFVAVKSLLDRARIY